MSPPFPTLIALLQERAQRQANQNAYIFLADGENETQTLSYAELDLQARTIAAHLQQRTTPGDRALLAYPPGLPFLSALFGCLYAGLIAVPTSLPHHKRPDRRFQSVLTDAEPSHILTDQATLSLIQDQLQTLFAKTNPECLGTDTLSDDLAATWTPPEIRGDTIAWLQYTSGSTGAPKGVMVSHTNWLYNEEMLRQAFQTGPESVCVIWVPHFHDMGLGLFLQALYVGFPCVFMPPMAFVQRPARWLRAITRYRGTLTGAPNFAYELCQKKASPDLLAELDLSSWKVALNGAEPIHADTLERFFKTFSSCGFRAATFFPAYGLAEASVFVSGGLAQQQPRLRQVEADALEQHRFRISPTGQAATRTLVSCGRSWLDQQIAIVTPETHRRCKEAEVGEIWVAGPHVSAGYWQKPEATQETFGAYLRDETNGTSGPFLRTGDLGVIHEGELFVTGRLKDVIIIRGRNYYPQDIEWLVEQLHPRLRPHSVVAFTVEVETEERLVIVQEAGPRFKTDRDAARYLGELQQELSNQFQLRAWAIVLVPPKSIPVTSSGKVQRQACRRLFLSQSLPQVLAYYDPEPDAKQVLELQPPEDCSPQGLEIWLSRQLAQKLERDQVNPHDSFFDLNLDSLQLVNLLVQVETALDQSVPIQQLVQRPTIAHLAHLLSQPQSAALPPVVSDVPSQSVIPQPSLRSRAHYRLLHVGPSWRSRGLSYAFGSRLLYRVVQQKWVQNQVYHNQMELVTRCLAEVPHEQSVAKVVEQSLRVNSWALWRTQALSEPEEFDRWVTIKNRAIIDDSVKEGTGAVLAMSHTPLKRLLWHVPMLKQHELAVVGNMGSASLRRIGLGELANSAAFVSEPTGIASRVAQLYHAQEVLKRGGVAIVFPGDTVGEGGIRVAFHGRYRWFRPGMAELALRTNSRLIPAFAKLHSTGAVTLELLAPLEAEGGSTAERVETLLYQYADILSARWVTDLGQLEWYILRKFLQFPQVE